MIIQIFRELIFKKIVIENMNTKILNQKIKIMTTQEIKKTSKFISYVLRHAPEKLKLEMDKNGWVNTKELIQKLNNKMPNFNMESLEIIVAENNKKRFAFNADKSKIRANQGHSIKIDLAYQPTEPPEFLYHGTAIKNIESIKNQGLVKGKRHHVHLSADKATALNVGQRHGEPVILIIETKKMFEAGYEFFISENQVWLSEVVPVDFIGFE